MKAKTQNINYPKIGEGIFLIRDVAEILVLPYSKVRHWLIEFWEGKFSSDYRYSLGSKENRSVNFHTLIEFYTFFHLRNSGLSSQKIQKYHIQLSKELKTQYPFARTIHTDGKAIWYEALDELVKVDGKRQLDMKLILNQFLQKIEFGSNGLAERYFPLEDSQNIVVDPKHQFGAPTIKGTNIKAFVINDFYKSGESIDTICDLYEIKREEVLDVIKYYNRAA